MIPQQKAITYRPLPLPEVKRPPPKPKKPKKPKVEEPEPVPKPRPVVVPLPEPVDLLLHTPYGDILQSQLKRLPRVSQYVVAPAGKDNYNRRGEVDSVLCSVFMYTTGGGSRVIHKPEPGGEYDETHPKQYYILEHLNDLETELLDSNNATRLDACPW